MADRQFSFDLGPLRPPDIFYFALRPDAAAAQAMTDVAERCRKRHGLSGRPYDADRLHLSLSPVVSRYGVGQDDVAAAAEAAARVEADRFPVAFDRICTFGSRNRRPIVLCCDGGWSALAAFRHSLRGELVKVGLRLGPPNFQPHVTLLWDKRSVADARLDEPIGWTVDAFVLVRSLTGRSRQIEVGRWPLGATQRRRTRLPGGSAQSPEPPGCAPPPWPDRARRPYG